MNLANICHVDKNLLDEKINFFIENDNSLTNHYKEKLYNLIFSSGKRLRPVFTVLGSYFGDNQKNKNIYEIAAMFELIHTASLIHDDIIDNADTRRGNPSTHTKIGEYNAIFLGNYLVSLCCEYISKYNLENIYYNNLNLTSLCKSEIDQQSLLFNFDINYNEYINKTKNKTALLISASLVAGAKLTGATDKTLDILNDYAINLGISFQIIDDILDFTQKRERLGKPNGSDLINGNITLPVILALKDRNLAPKIKKLNKNSSIEEFRECINLIINSDLINKSINISKKFLTKAKKSLKNLKHDKKRILITILDELEKRTY